MESVVSFLEWSFGLSLVFYGAVAMAVWNYVGRVQDDMEASCAALKRDVESGDDKAMLLIAKQSDQARADAADYNRRFATKEDTNDLKRDISSMRSDMNSQFGTINTQLAQIITMIAR